MAASRNSPNGHGEVPRDRSSPWGRALRASLRRSLRRVLDKRRGICSHFPHEAPQRGRGEEQRDRGGKRAGTHGRRDADRGQKPASGAGFHQCPQHHRGECPPSKSFPARAVKPHRSGLAARPPHRVPRFRALRARNVTRDRSIYPPAVLQVGARDAEDPGLGTAAARRWWRRSTRRRCRAQSR
jgi:hypothetical protein